MMPNFKSGQKKVFTKFPAVPPIEHNPDFKTYHCPFCKKSIAQGSIHRLMMVCGFCYQFIQADEIELLKGS